MATAQELAMELYLVRSQIDSLRLQETDLTERLAAEMEENRLEVPGMGIFERRFGKERKAWDHDGLRAAILRKMRDGVVKPERHIDDEGEITEEQADEFALRVLTEHAHIDYWRAKSLKAIDIAVDEFCESKPGKVSVQFVGSLDGGAA